MALYTIDEINTDIADTKAAIKRALQAHDYTNGSKRVTREMLSELRKHLRWLEVERDKLLGVAGPRILPGRVAR